MKLTDKIELLNEDNMAVMARYPDKYFDLAIVDPPYGISINNNMGRRKGDKHSDYKKVDWDSVIPSPEYFKELLRVSKNQIVWGGNYMTEYLPPSPCWLLWDKGFSEDLSFAQFELAWTSFKSSAKKFDKTSAQQNRIHPTQKPVQLYDWLLRKFAKKDFKVLDTHLGSGSIAISAHYFGCVFVGCEIDKDYYNAAIARVKQQTRQIDIFAGFDMPSPKTLSLLA